MTFPARIIGLLLVFVFGITFILTPLANAQTVTPAYASLMKTESNVPMNINTLTQGVFMGMLSFATCALGGVDFTTPTHTCLIYNSKTQTYGYAPEIGGGILGAEVGSFAILYTKPMGTSDYTRYMASNFGLVKKADASSGFDQLKPLTKIWLAMRNIAYLLFVIVFVIIGFAVMLRAKVDPRTVMTIENQLPKLIVALIIITFSFAIAGLVIDLMWVLVYLCINLFASLDPQLHGQIGALTKDVYDNPFGWINNLTSGIGGLIGIPGQAAGSVKDITQVILNGVFDQAPILKTILTVIGGIPILLGCAVNEVVHFGIGVDFGQCVSDGVTTIISSVTAVIAFLIFAIALIVGLARLWWALLKSYSLFLVYAMFGPVMIMAGVIPGAKVNFENWIRHLLAYTVVFPLAMAIFLLGKVLMDLYNAASPGTPGYIPPLAGVSPGISAVIGPLLGFSIFMLGPQALTMVQDALNAPDPKYLAGLGQLMGVGSQAFSAGTGKVWERAWRESDPLHNRDEGWLRKIVLPQGSPIRRFFLGREIKPLENYTRPNRGAGQH